uniref:Uncharacterized protein n=1 Tax=Tanacetum cinerariifolium TaxID=118510 RepID=A0A6L2JYE0_TANCI|nr:hypothetical protein [Tanacetum cinerariifolium]
MKQFIDEKTNGQLLLNYIFDGSYVQRQVIILDDHAQNPPTAAITQEQLDTDLSEIELAQVRADKQAMNLILLGLRNDIYSTIDNCPSAYAMSKAIEWKMHGIKVRQQEKEVILLWDYEKFTSVPGNQLHHTIKSKNLHEADFNQIFDVLKQNQNEANDIKAELERRKHDPLALVADSPSAYSLTPCNNH